MLQSKIQSNKNQLRATACPGLKATPFNFDCCSKENHSSYMNTINQQLHENNQPTAATGKSPASSSYMKPPPTSSSKSMSCVFFPLQTLSESGVECKPSSHLACPGFKLSPTLPRVLFFLQAFQPSGSVLVLPVQASHFLALALAVAVRMFFT